MAKGVPMFRALILSLVLTFAIPSTLYAGICIVPVCPVADTPDTDNDGFCDPLDTWPGHNDCLYQKTPEIGDFMVANVVSENSWKETKLSELKLVFVSDKDLWIFANGKKLRLNPINSGEEYPGWVVRCTDYILAVNVEKIVSTEDCCFQSCYDQVKMKLIVAENSVVTGIVYADPMESMGNNQIQIFDPRKKP